jgi:hypothetical protein
MYVHTGPYFFMGLDVFLSCLSFRVEEKPCTVPREHAQIVPRKESEKS